jgi:hypothetical protein
MTRPVLNHIAARWSMVNYPSKQDEWSLDRKFADAKAAGFDGVIHPPRDDLKDLTAKHGLKLLGFFSSGKVAEFSSLLQANLACGAYHINVQLADEDTLTPEAVGLALALIQEGAKLGVEPAIEVHRDTCTETPEKAYALADAYQKITGQLMPITWDFSHFAVVKHFHFRPFNGHHCQIPVTDGMGNLTSEVKDWLVFAEAVLKCWLEGNRGTGRELFVCPEMGPVPGGYNLSVLPNSWEDAKILRLQIDRIWKSLVERS